MSQRGVNASLEEQMARLHDNMSARDKRRNQQHDMRQVRSQGQHASADQHNAERISLVSSSGGRGHAGKLSMSSRQHHVLMLPYRPARIRTRMSRTENGLLAEVRWLLTARIGLDSGRCMVPQVVM
jgi:hypothetical protein